MRSALTRTLSPKWQHRARRLDRLRWVAKFKATRSVHSNASLRRRLAYVLFDPELASFSFELENEQEVIAGLAVALGQPEDTLATYVAETRADPELNEELARHVRWRPDIKRRQPLGHRLAWYVMARVYEPKLIVETGIHRGLGSLALLRALDHNRREGHPGELMSFDTDPEAGSIVRDQVQGDWRRILGSTHDRLLPALAGRSVDMLFQDTPHTEENQRLEFEAALSHAAPRLLLLDASGGWAPTLEALCAEQGGAYHRVPFRTRDHILSGSAICFATFENAPIRGGRPG
jgi:hypothetical protein